jgi:hypothetical protein
MEAIVIVLVVLLLGPLAVVAGKDSRVQDPRNRRAWWPGERGPQ